MLADKESLLGDLDDYGDYLTRPVGETIARLCLALGLPADARVKQDNVWLITRDPSPSEKYRQNRAADLKHSPPPPARRDFPAPSPLWATLGKGGRTMRFLCWGNTGD